MKAFFGSIFGSIFKWLMQPFRRKLSPEKVATLRMLLENMRGSRDSYR